MAIFPFVRLYPARVLANSVCLVQEGVFFPTKSRGVANFRFCGVRSTKNMRSSKRWHNRKAVTKNCLWSQWMKRDKHCHSTGAFRIRVIRTCFHDLFGLSKYLPEAASIGEWGKLLLNWVFPVVDPKWSMCAPLPLNLSSVQLPVKERITGAFRPWKMVCACHGKPKPGFLASLANPWNPPLETHVQWC